MTKTTGKCVREINGQVFDVQHNNNNIYQMPSTRKERLGMLKRFIIKECGKCWASQPKKVATLKREFLNELISSIE